MRMGGGRFEGANPYASMLILQPSNLGRAASPLAASLMIQPSCPHLPRNVDSNEELARSSCLRLFFHEAFG